MTKKGKRAYITPEAEARIISRAVAYPREQRTKLAEKLQEEFKIEKWDIPEIEVLERKISKYRTHIKRNKNPEDEPWTLDSLKDKPLPPDALLSVFHVWLLKQEESWSPPLSMREARWASQLSGTIKDLYTLKAAAETCADWEIIGELMKEPHLSTPDMMLYIYEEIIEGNIGKEHEQRLLAAKQSLRKADQRTKPLSDQIYRKGIIEGL